MGLNSGKEAKPERKLRRFIGHLHQGMLRVYTSAALASGCISRGSIHCGSTGIDADLLLIYTATHFGLEPQVKAHPAPPTAGGSHVWFQAPIAVFCSRCSWGRLSLARIAGSARGRGSSSYVAAPRCRTQESPRTRCSHQSRSCRTEQKSHKERCGETLRARHATEDRSRTDGFSHFPFLACDEKGGGD